MKAHDCPWEKVAVDRIKAPTASAIAIGPFGSRMKSDTYTLTGVPVVRGNNISDTTELKGEFVFISPDFADGLSGCKLEPGDLFFPHRGNIGEVGIINGKQGHRFTMSTSLMKLTPDPEQADPFFLFYFFRSPAGRHELLKNASQVGTPGIATPLASLRSLIVPLPPLPVQKAIAELLRTIDEKIDLNRRMNATMEGMVQALFQAWSMALQPVRAKASELVEQGILEIGDGYRAKNSELGPDGLPFVRAGNLNDGFDLDGAELLRPESVAKAGSKISRSDDVAFTSKGTVGRIARVSGDMPSFVYSPQICYWRSLAPDRVHPAVLYCWMASADFQDQVQAFSHQTDMAPYISLRDQRQIEVPIFPTSQLELGGQIDEFLAKQALNVSESRTLAALRDLLLPKLMSGEVRVRP